jgi:hypothetical protein
LSQTIYIIKEFVLKLSSKCYASGGNFAKLRRMEDNRDAKNMGARERRERWSEKERES